MATYLQGVQDVVEGVNPPQQNLQFEAQTLGARQSAYNTSYNQVSKMYGTILNSSLTREDNIQARDEFFKLVGSDIKKIAGLDLSKEANQTKAQGVFKQIYDNDFLVKDMVWTKNYQTQMQKAEGFKNCIDPAKCGGEYWDEGVKYLQYKRQEFAETDQQDALGFEDVEYVPYNNLMEDAMKAAKESGLDVTMDQISGNYKVTTKNGELLVSPLTELFSSLYGKNPGYQKQFEVQSYNERKDWASQKINEGKYKNMQEAEVGFITEKARVMNEAVDKISADINADNDLLDGQLKNLTEKIQNGQVAEGSDDHKRYMQLTQLKAMSDQAKQYTDISQLALKKANNHKAIRSIGAQMDQASAVIKLNDEIENAAGVLSNRGAEVTLEADEFAKMRVDHQYDVALENLKQSHKIAAEQWKLEHGHSSYAGSGEDKAMSIGHSIEKDFKAKFGASTEAKMSKINADALAKYPQVSQAEIDKTGGKDAPKDSPERKNWERKVKEKELNDKARAEYVLKAKARSIDQFNQQAGVESSYYQTLNDFGADVPMSIASGGSGGSGYSENGFTGGSRKSTRGGGSPSGSQQSDEPFNFSQIKFDEKNLKDDELKHVAESHPNPEKRAYYQSIVKKGGAEYVKKMPEKERQQIYNNVGKRIDESAASYQGWQASQSTEIKENLKTGASEKVFAKSNSEAREKRLQASSKITNEYLKTAKKEELKSTQNWTEKYLIKNGTIDKYGMLSYNGKEIGFVYRTMDGTEQRYAHGGSEDLKIQERISKDKNPKEANKWANQFHFHPNNKSEILSKGQIQRLASNSKYYSESLYNARIKNRIDESHGDFFGSDEYKRVKAEHEKYTKVHQSYQQSKKDMEPSIKASVNARIVKTDVFGKTSIDADEIIKDGYFRPSERIQNSPTLRAEAYRIYRDAMDNVYKERNVKDYYLPGMGSVYARTMKAYNVDLNSEKDDVADDVRDFLSVFRTGDVKNNTAAMFIDKKGTSQRQAVDMDNMEKIVDDFLEGRIDIRSVHYNPVSGSNPQEKGQGDNLNWSRLIINAENGEKYEFNVDNSKHSTGIYNKSQSSELTKVLNEVGQYVVKPAGTLTQQKPIKIVKKSSTQIGISGKVYAWDQNAQMAKFDDIEDVLEEAGVNINQYTPEELTEYVNLVLTASEQQYNMFNPKAKL